MPGEPQPYFDFVGHWFRPDGGEPREPDQGFFSIAGKAEELTFTSENPQLLEIGPDDERGLDVVFKEAGDVHIVVALAGKTFKLPVRIVRLNIKQGDDSKEVVKAYGLPDRETSYTVSWPARELHDSLAYVPGEGQTIRAKHWRYDKYPWLVISIVDGRVHNISSSRDSMRLLVPLAIDGTHIKGKFEN